MLPLTSGGRRNTSSPHSWMGTPSKLSGTTFTPFRIATVTLAARPARSNAISAPELPAPIIRTRFPVNGRAVRYSDECWMLPRKLSIPGQVGRIGESKIPEAATRTRAR